MATMERRWRGVVWAAVLVAACAEATIAADAPLPNALQAGPQYPAWTPAGRDNTAETKVARLAAVVPPAAPMPPGTTLAELEDLAQRNNPTLCQAAARIQAAKGEWTQAGLYPNPHAGYRANEIGDDKQAGQQGAIVSQEFVTAGKLQRAQEVASQTIRQAEWAWQTQRQRVLNDVRVAFYDVLVAQRALELCDQLLSVSQEIVRASESLLQAKEASRVDVLQAKIEVNSAEIIDEKAKNRHRAAWRNLATVIGVPDMPAGALVGDLRDGLPSYTWEEAVDRVLADHPLVLQARAGVAHAEAVLSQQCAERIPNLDVQAGAYYDNATSDPIAEVEVGLALPVFNRNQGNIRKAQADVVAARNEARRVELELRQQLAQAFEQYQNGLCQVEKYAEYILPNAQESLRLVTEGYEQGEFQYVVLLTAQQTFFRVSLAYVDAIRELRSASVALEGKLLSNSLQGR